MVSGSIDGTQPVLASGEAVWLGLIGGDNIDAHDPLAIRWVVDTLDAIAVSGSTRRVSSVHTLKKAKAVGSNGSACWKPVGNL